VLGDSPSEAVIGDVIDENEPVHASGPDVIGMEDMGPQTPGSGLAGGLDLEGALGRVWLLLWGGSMRETRKGKKRTEMEMLLLRILMVLLRGKKERL
jgi:hypothetical protein